MPTNGLWACTNKEGGEEARKIKEWKWEEWVGLEGIKCIDSLRLEAEVFLLRRMEEQIIQTLSKKKKKEGTSHLDAGTN